MEDILDLYEEPFDPKRPVVCLDEQPYQHLSDCIEPLAAQPGQSMREDYTYKRRGVCNFFMIFQPLGGWRHVKLTDRRTTLDYAQCLKDIVDLHFPEAEQIRVVQDNLNTHKFSALYEAFDPEEARRLVSKLEFHYTPKHASWLDMAEIEFSALNRQCTQRRFSDRKTLAQNIEAWERRRNQNNTTVKWKFTTRQARLKMKRAYPV